MTDGYLARQVAALDRDVEAVRRREPEGVHRARIDCRRLRAVAPRGPLRDELRWLGDQLSAARDRYVVHQLLVRMVVEEPAGLVDPSVERRLERTYGGTRPSPDALDSPRFAALRAELAALDPQPRVTRRRVRNELDRVVRRHRAVAERPGDDPAMHDLRKAAKRLRYTAEAWEPDGGKDARRLAAAAKRLTQHLGERQDTVVVRAHLLRLAEAAAAEGEPAFTYGRLHAREQARAAALDEALPAVWERFTGPATRSTC
ncbi:CHAD domain-containing protein [Nocardioides aquiterrae]|uniref:CHAD domain-containing protein n=1 Tax=Nocardioides aquiterrae TaxID=203799 RepID=A0ABP4F1L9_9ACTN